MGKSVEVDVNEHVHLRMETDLLLLSFQFLSLQHHFLGMIVETPAQRRKQEVELEKILTLLMWQTSTMVYSYPSWFL